MDGRLSALIVWAGLCLALPGAAQGRAPRPYDALTPSQVRLLGSWVAGSAAPAARDAALRQRYERAPDASRLAFEQVTDTLAMLLLTDPENGEVLGATLDLIDAVPPPEEQPGPAADGTVRLAVTLAPGARDRLRRSGEFRRLDSADPSTTFVHAGPPAVRITIAGAAASSAVVSMPTLSPDANVVGAASSPASHCRL